MNSIIESSLYSAEQAQRIDRYVIEQGLVDGYQLMQRAGLSLLTLISYRYPSAKRIGVFCGPGNNGGDGLVLASLLREQAIEVCVFSLKEPECWHDEASKAWHDYQAGGGAVDSFSLASLNECDLLVDALFGAGLSREISGEAGIWVEAMNESGLPVVSVDLPSGICGTTGKILGQAVVAQATMSFIAGKQGAFTAQGPDYVGSLFIDDLALPATVYQCIDEPVLRVTAQDVSPLWWPRGKNTHKGSYGKLGVIGGAPGMEGAAMLCAEAAMRSGAGLVKVWLHPASKSPVACPEVMMQTADLDPTALQALDAIVIGPGLGQDSWAREVLIEAIESGKPLVIDADGLNLLSSLSITLPSESVLTPHPGEAGMLLGLSNGEIQADRFQAVKALYQKYGVICVLKGFGSLIAGEGISMVTEGNAGMATAGSGDVLAGVIGALLAQNWPAEPAASAGVWLHAHAGDHAAMKGLNSLVASDIIESLRVIRG